LSLTEGDGLSHHWTMLTWTLVDQVAERLGATDVARRKWRQEGRGVPAAWRIRIAEEMMRAGAPVPLADFDRLEPNPGRVAA
jgi:hypothetical protein